MRGPSPPHPYPHRAIRTRCKGRTRTRVRVRAFVVVVATRVGEGGGWKLAIRSERRGEGSAGGKVGTEGGTQSRGMKGVEKMWVGRTPRSRAPDQPSKSHATAGSLAHAPKFSSRSAFRPVLFCEFRDRGRPRGALCRRGVAVLPAPAHRSCICISSGRLTRGESGKSPRGAVN